MTLLTRALTVAAQAHDGQTDRMGEPYVLHPLRVLLQLHPDEERQVALLHDVVEQTDWTLDRLAAEGFDARVLEAVDALSRRAGEDYFDFVRRAIANPLARPVKRADLLDNLRSARREPPGPKTRARIRRYRDALRLLDVHAPNVPLGAPAALPGAVGTLLSLPADLGSRQLALEQLRHARRARKRLNGRRDDEALHDFRVALRRLRSLQACYRDELRPVIGRRGRRALRAVARATGGARDAEVAVAWLAALLPDGPATPATRWLWRRLEDALRRGERELETALEEFDRLRKPLRRRLFRYRLRAGRGRAARARTVAAVLAPAGEALREHLLGSLAAGPPLSPEGVHAARIAAKRLRYALEPLAGLPSSLEALADLAALQDLLGGIRDRMGVLAHIEAALDGGQTSEEVQRLHRQATEERAALLEQLGREWLGTRAASSRLCNVDALLARVHAVADANVANVANVANGAAGTNEASSANGAAAAAGPAGPAGTNEPSGANGAPGAPGSAG